MSADMRPLRDLRFVLLDLLYVPAQLLRSGRGPALARRPVRSRMDVGLQASATCSRLDNSDPIDADKIAMACLYFSRVLAQSQTHTAEVRAVAASLMPATVTR